MKFLKKFICLCVVGFTVHANAAFITINEAGLDSIFSQASFGDNPIDIRIGLPSQIVAPELLDITMPVEITSLFSMHVGLATDVNFYFVDNISACGATIAPGIVGCGEFPGNDFVVESVFAASAFGPELLAHELGHNLGLPHVNGNILMNPFINNFTTITALEVATIMTSPLVKTDLDGSLYININPVLIVASRVPVPEPESIAILALSLVLLTVSRKKYASE